MASTRASLKSLPTNTQQNGIPTGTKRKAEVSPLKNDRVKRCALTNLTNNLNKNDSDENVVVKKVSSFGNIKEEVPNIQPIGYRTRAAAAAVTTITAISQQHAQKVQIKATKKLKPIAEIENANIGKESKNKATAVNAVTVLKSKQSIDSANKSSISTRRISNEFEKTEDSLYMSAFEEIPSDISRLSDKTKNSSQASSVFSSQSTANNSTLSTTDLDDILEASNRKLPVGMIHFDRENWNDVFQVSHYAMDIFEYLRHQEHKYQIKDYMSTQPELSKWMRSLLVDWMVEVQESFELNHETLYLAIKIVDTYLGKEKVAKDSLQLLGAAALLIACKYDERTPPLVDDFLFICDGAYKRNQLLRMETNVFRAINYDLGFPLSYRFLRRFARCGKVTMQTLTLARYILEYSLMDYSTVLLSDAKMACAALFMAQRMIHSEGWNATMEYYSGYRLMDFAPIVVLLNTLLHKKPKETLSTVKNKYSNKIFHQVASIPLMDINTLFDKFPEITEKFTSTQLTYQSVVTTCSSSSLNIETNKGKESSRYRTVESKALSRTKSMPLPFIR